jgi:hypothetical protein
MALEDRLVRQAQNESVYERVRSQDDRFVVRPGYETPDLEHAIEWSDSYVVVDKIPAAEPYVAGDPRDAPSH